MNGKEEKVIAQGTQTFSSSATTLTQGMSVYNIKVIVKPGAKFTLNTGEVSEITQTAVNSEDIGQEIKK